MAKEDAELSTLLECLRLSQGAIKRDPEQLPGQILGRVSEVKYVSNKLRKNKSIVPLALTSVEILMPNLNYYVTEMLQNCRVTNIY